MANIRVSYNYGTGSNNPTYKNVIVYHRDRYVEIVDIETKKSIAEFFYGFLIYIEYLEDQTKINLEKKPAPIPPPPYSEHGSQIKKGL